MYTPAPCWAWLCLSPYLAPPPPRTQISFGHSKRYKSGVFAVKPKRAQEYMPNTRFKTSIEIKTLLMSRHSMVPCLTCICLYTFLFIIWNAYANGHVLTFKCVYVDVYVYVCVCITIAHCKWLYYYTIRIRRCSRCFTAWCFVRYIRIITHTHDE